jgi:hypothetical protein
VPNILFYCHSIIPLAPQHDGLPPILLDKATVKAQRSYGNNQLWSFEWNIRLTFEKKGSKNNKI